MNAIRLWWLSAILALLPTYLIRFNIGPFPSTFLEVLVVVFLFVTLIFEYKNIPGLKRLGKINIFTSLFVISGIIAVAASPETYKALGQLKAFIVEPVLFFYAIVLTIKHPQDYRAPLTGLLVGSLGVSIFGVIQHWTGIWLPLRFWGYSEGVLRITSFFEHPNALALYLGPILGFFFALRQKHSTLVNRTLLNWSLPVLALSLFFTYSRGAWLAVICAVIFLSIRKYSLRLVLPATIILVLLGAWLIPSAADRIRLADSSDEARLGLYKVAANKILESPLVGNGLHGFRTTLTEANFAGEVLNYPHNIFMNFWLEMGLLGLLAFALIFNAALSRHKLQPSAITLSVAIFLFVLLIHGLVDAPYFKNDLSLLFWFMVALIYVPQISETKTAQ